MTFALLFLMAWIQVLQPGTGIVTGTIRAADGQSVRAIRVAAVPIDDPTGTSLASLAETDSAGRFRLINLPAGSYYIVAGSVQLPSFYPSGTARDGATAVAVEPARVTSGIDFTLVAESRTVPPPPSRADIYTIFQRAYSEKDPNVKLRLLLDFERRFPNSEYLNEVQVAVMGLYGMRGETLKAADYANRALKIDPNDIVILVSVSRNYAMMYSGLPKAVQYADQAVAAVTKIKGQGPPVPANAQSWTEWVASLEKSALENQAWVRTIAARQAAGTPRR